MFRLFSLSVLLLAHICAAQVDYFVVTPTKNPGKSSILLADTAITLSPAATIEAIHFAPTQSVTFTSPFKKVERAGPYALTGDFPEGNLRPLSLAPGAYRVSAYSTDRFNPTSTPFRVFSKPMVAPLTFPPTFKGGKAVLRANVNFKETTGPITYQWELTTISGDTPKPIKGATGSTLTLKSVKCEEFTCFPRGGGCIDFLRYTVQVCDSIGCVRSNPVSPNVVSRKGGKSVCEPFFQEFMTTLEVLPLAPKIVYPRTVLGEKAVLRVNTPATPGLSYQWEVTTFGFSDSNQPPEPIKGATGRTLTINDATCEKSDCSRVGCSNLLRYSVKVCNFRGCVRSNAVVPNVVAGNGAAARRKFNAESCWAVEVELKPYGEPRRGVGTN